jgi:perosamine synthetase
VLGGREIDYLRECIESGWVSYLGPFVERFERAIADFVGAPHALATSSGTAALHLALLAVGVRPEDEVIVPTLTFIAPANAVRYVGAHPVFVDAEPNYWQMDVRRVAEFLELGCRPQGENLINRDSGRRVTAILPVHVLGHPVDMDPILELARRFGLRVVEDATESLGARYKGRAVGSLADAACFSFNGNKLITSGGGGMVVSADADLIRRARHLSTQAKTDAVEYVHDAIGFNYRLTNIQAAVGCAQAERLEEFIAAKRAIAARYRAALAGTPGVETMPEAAWAEAVFWMYTVRLKASGKASGGRPVLRGLAAQGIQTRPLWQPLHLSPAHRGSQALGGAVAEGLYHQALSLPCSADLQPAEQERAIAALKQELAGMGAPKVLTEA